jgi:hypothetical protein
LGYAINIWIQKRIIHIKAVAVPCTWSQSLTLAYTVNIIMYPPQAILDADASVKAKLLFYKTAGVEFTICDSINNDFLKKTQRLHQRAKQLVDQNKWIDHLSVEERQQLNIPALLTERHKMYLKTLNIKK